MRSREEMKRIALAFMKSIGMSAGTVAALDIFDMPMLFEYDTFEGEVIDGNARMLRVKDKIKELEDEFGFFIYAVTHEQMIFGECYSFLFVSRYEDDGPVSKVSDGDSFRVYAYVWNVTYDSCSEIGSVIIQSFHGGISRIG